MLFIFIKKNKAGIAFVSRFLNSFLCEAGFLGQMLETKFSTFNYYCTILHSKNNCSIHALIIWFSKFGD